jgi:hypothetical protein
MLLKSKLRPAVRQLLVERLGVLLDEVAQIEEVLNEDDLHTLVGMPAFAVHAKVPHVLRRKRHTTSPPNPH